MSARRSTWAGRPGQRFAALVAGLAMEQHPAKRMDRGAPPSEIWGRNANFLGNRG